MRCPQCDDDVSRTFSGDYYCSACGELGREVVERYDTPRMVWLFPVDGRGDGHSARISQRLLRGETVEVDGRLYWWRKW